MAAYEAAQISTPPSGRAVVLGGGLAGVLAARALTDTFEEIVIIERHNRLIVEQVLPQVLSETVRPQLDRLFPGFSAELVADGAAIAAPSGHRSISTAAPGAERVDARLQFTHEFIHRHLSRHLNSFDGVAMLGGCDAVGLVGDGERCAGVHVLPRSRSAASRTIPADLVVDAMGAGSRLCLWIEDTWRIRLPSERQLITYFASRLYQTRARSLPAATTIDLRPAYSYRIALMTVENGQYVASLGAPNIPAHDGDQFDQLLSSLLPQQLAALIADSQAAGPVIIFASAGMRRRFHNADRLPGNLIALGDSLCCFDPLQGHSFEVAVRQASVLWQLLGEQHSYADNGQPTELARRYFRAVAKIVDDAWMVGA